MYFSSLSMNTKEILVRIKVRDNEIVDEILDEIDRTIYRTLFYSLELSSKDVNYSIEVKKKKRKFVNYQ